MADPASFKRKVLSATVTTMFSPSLDYFGLMPKNEPIICYNLPWKPFG